ncbi:MAG: NAD(P)-dependent alcohol dehydrogenase [Acidimicrobiia bacterium]|nr:NAD(P)-dependent alcohol dehydrogenase [Acidimicrobiia bacterium]
MRAIVQRAFGSAETLQLTDIETPRIEADEVLIEVHAAGVDRGVWHLMMGMPYLVRLAGFGFTKPKTPIPGLDVSGRVVAVGSSVSRFEVGDEVFGIARGSYAEFAAAKASKLAHKPANLSFEQAAVAAISGITALQGLTDVAKLEPGRRVLVIGASGGVGTFAVQLAKALGGDVTGVASGRKLDLVRSLGADHAIDYATTDYLDGTTQYDLILDAGGLNPLRRLRKALKKNGTLVIVGGEGGGHITGGIGRQLRAMLLSPFVSQRLTMFISTESHTHIERLAEYMASGQVSPAVGCRYRLEEVPAAIADLEAGNALGKSVIVVRGSDTNPR